MFATAHEVSFWQWMPSRRTTSSDVEPSSSASRSATSCTARVTIEGSMPPLVSHMTATSAPASSAAAATEAV